MTKDLNVMHEILTPKERESFREEWEAFEIEAKFNLALNSLQWAHRGGELIRSWVKGELTDIAVEEVQSITGKSRSTIFRWVALYDKEPEFEKLIAEHGKALSMNKILGLSGPSDDSEKCVCPTCGKEHKKQ